MTYRLISLFLIVLIIYACTLKPKSYESATKWHVSCRPYPAYHPGDVNKVGDPGDVRDEFRNAIKESWYGCKSECNKKYVCNKARGQVSCEENIGSCVKSCLEEIAKAHSVAYHIEGGYYSDGSYYASCYPFYFTNIHPTADKYKKTKWQTDRDDCMKLTSENFKPSYWDKTGYFKPGKDYYKNCLKERGYLN